MALHGTFCILETRLQVSGLLPRINRQAPPGPFCRQHTISTFLCLSSEIQESQWLQAGRTNSNVWSQHTNYCSLNTITAPVSVGYSRNRASEDSSLIRSFAMVGLMRISILRSKAGSQDKYLSRWEKTIISM